ncbi:MAG: hypothetical protein RIB60_06045 [Phycisphaerales bacterium]
MAEVVDRAQGGQATEAPKPKSKAPKNKGEASTAVDAPNESGQGLTSAGLLFEDRENARMRVEVLAAILKPEKRVTKSQVEGIKEVHAELCKACGIPEVGA